MTDDDDEDEDEDEDDDRTPGDCSLDSSKNEVSRSRIVLPR